MRYVVGLLWSDDLIYTRYKMPVSGSSAEKTWENREVARLLELPPSQLIFWANRGLVKPVFAPPTRGGRRRYNIFNLFQFIVLRELWKVGGQVELMTQAMAAIKHAVLGDVFFWEEEVRRARQERGQEGLPFLSQEYRRYLIVFPPRQEKRVGILVRVPSGDALHSLYCQVGTERIKTDDDLFVDDGHVEMTVKPKDFGCWTRDELLPSSENPTVVLMDLTALKEELERRAE